MKHKLTLVVMSSLLFIGWLGRAQFTEKRVKKGPSMATLKEQCCAVSGDLLHDIPSLLHAAADLQKQIVALIEGYYQGDKESFCNRASRDELIKRKESLEQVNQTLKSLCTEITACLEQLHS